MKLLFSAPRAFGDLPLLSLQNITAKIHRLEAGKHDIVVPLSDVRFTDMNVVEVATHGRLVLTELAFSHLCTLLRVPFEYMQRCPLTLRNDNLVYWMDQYEDRKVLLRTRTREQDAVIRAILPKTYEPIDNPRILEWVAQAMQRFQGTLGVQSAQVSEVSTHFRLLFETPIRLNDPTTGVADTHFFGVHVCDSEVGARAFTADVVDYRPRSDSGCLYKLDGKHLVRQRHIHVDVPSVRRALDDGFSVARDSQDILMRILRAAQQVTVADTYAGIRRLVRQYRLPNEFAEAVLTAYETEPMPTFYGLVQAFTRAAKRLPIDLRVDTELCGGAFLLGAT
jgi:hypothetical protein